MTWIEPFRSHRLLLWLMAAAGLALINGPYLYVAFTTPDSLIHLMQNPAGAAFVAEALIMTIFATVVVAVSGLRKPGWVAFVGLAVAGSLAFAVPAFILWHLHRRSPEPSTEHASSAS
jgi:hypothetical protein